MWHDINTLVILDVKTEIKQLRPPENLQSAVVLCFPTCCLSLCLCPSSTLTRRTQQNQGYLLSARSEPYSVLNPKNVQLTSKNKKITCSSWTEVKMCYFCLIRLSRRTGSSSTIHRLSFVLLGSFLSSLLPPPFPLIFIWKKHNFHPISVTI